MTLPVELIQTLQTSGPEVFTFLSNALIDMASQVLEHGQECTTAIGNVGQWLDLPDKTTITGLFRSFVFNSGIPLVEVEQETMSRLSQVIDFNGLTALDQLSGQGGACLSQTDFQAINAHIQNPQVLDISMTRQEVADAANTLLNPISTLTPTALDPNLLTSDTSLLNQDTPPNSNGGITEHLGPLSLLLVPIIIGGAIIKEKFFRKNTSE